MRVVLCTGKGGVGKTSVAAATAIACSRLGHRTLVISTDPAHSLGDCLDQELGLEPLQVSDGLWAQEISALHELQRSWNTIHTYLSRLFASMGVDDMVAEEVASPPGMEEIASLLWIRRHYDSQAFDALVVDCAPTGETLQLLSLPDVAKWWLHKLFPLERRIMRVARPMVQPLVPLPLPSDAVYAAIKELLEQLDGVKSILTDPDTTSVRIVLNLEKMVIKEARRAFTYLNLYGYMTDMVVVNRTLPAQIQDGFFAGWKVIHKGYMEEVHRSFDPVPIFTAPLFDSEVIGIEMLSKLADSLYGSEDPTKRFYNYQPQQVQRKGNEYLLRLRLPFVDKREIDLSHGDGALIVRLGAYQREVALPKALQRRPVLGAHMEADQLVVRFGRRD